MKNNHIYSSYVCSVKITKKIVKLKKRFKPMTYGEIPTVHQSVWNMYRRIKAISLVIILAMRPRPQDLVGFIPSVPQCRRIKNNKHKIRAIAQANYRCDFLTSNLKIQICKKNHLDNNIYQCLSGYLSFLHYLSSSIIINSVSLFLFLQINHQ